MPVRVLICFLAIVVLIGYSWRRSWFIGACGAIVLMAFVEHPEMPRTLLGIPGLSPWNILIINVTFAWLHQRPYEGAAWDLPAYMSRVLFLFIGVLFVAFVRVLIDPTIYCPFTTAGIINEGFVNSLKFMFPFFWFFDGCRNEQRTRAALVCVVVLYAFLGLIIVRHMGLHSGAAGGDLNGRAAKLVRTTTGYHRVDMAMMLAGASWGALACVGLMKSTKLKLAALGVFAVMTMAEALTGGRTGYMTWCVIGLLLCLLRWRRALLLLPVAVAGVVFLMPAVVDRMSMGFGETSGRIVEKSDRNQITSDRTAVWPYAMDGINASPLFGYGRFAFMRSGISSKVAGDMGEEVGHPHNAYLELLLDNGILGSLLVLPIYLVIVFASLRMFLDRSNTLNSASGGLALALFLALLIASVGAQSLYPREGVAGMWAAAGIVIRRYLDWRQARRASYEIEPEEVSSIDPETARAV
jgi:O-antigen ligase